MYIIYSWVLVIGAYGGGSSPIISQPVADLASCERMQKAINLGSARTSQCVEVKMVVAK